MPYSAYLKESAVAQRDWESFTNYFSKGLLNLEFISPHFTLINSDVLASSSHEAD